MHCMFSGTGKVIFFILTTYKTANGKYRSLLSITERPAESDQTIKMSCSFDAHTTSMWKRVYDKLLPLPDQKFSAQVLKSNFYRREYEGFFMIR